jgi:hypothetical protein
MEEYWSNLVIILYKDFVVKHQDRKSLNVSLAVEILYLFMHKSFYTKSKGNSSMIKAVFLDSDKNHLMLFVILIIAYKLEVC